MKPKRMWAFNAFGLSMRGMKISFPCHIGPTLILAGLRQIVVEGNVVIWPGLRIEAHGEAIITIERDVVIGPNCHITCASDMTIGRGSILDGMNVLTNINHSAEELDKWVNERPWQITPTILGKNVHYGHGACILPGAVVPDESVIEANAVVASTTATAASYFAGIPARPSDLPIDYKEVGEILSH